jgi:cysteine-S-conjugate beta-lyase
MKFETVLIHGGVEGDEQTGAVSVPIFQTSTYRQRALGASPVYDYSRAANPTRCALEKLIAEMEEGVAGFAFASGMAAISTVLMLFKSGDKVLISDNIYGGTFRVLDQVFNHFGLAYEIVDTNDERAVDRKIDASTRALFVETPTNPTLGITDIARAAAAARRRGLLTIVDNTFMTPYLQKPLVLGADIVLHSATKYLGGHSDLLAGLVVAGSKELGERIRFLQKSTGGILSPSDSWLLIRSIKTLAVRLDRHLENALRVASFLRANPAVGKLYFPGFPDHPGYEIQKRQARGPGAIVSFTLGDGYAVDRFVSGLEVITFGESLGGVESLLTHPASMTHGSIPFDLRQRMGIVDNLVRLSVGIEDKEDLVRDLQNAFDQAKA